MKEKIKHVKCFKYTDGENAGRTFFKVAFEKNKDPIKVIDMQLLALFPDGFGDVTPEEVHSEDEFEK